MIVPFIFGGSGMALVFAPSASAILSVVRPDQAGQASGAATRSARSAASSGSRCSATVFAGAGSYAGGHAFVYGLVPSLWVGVAVLAAGAFVVLVFPFATARVGEAAHAGAVEEAARGAAARVARGEGPIGDVGGPVLVGEPA